MEAVDATDSIGGSEAELGDCYRLSEPQRKVIDSVDGSLALDLAALRLSSGDETSRWKGDGRMYRAMSVLRYARRTFNVMKASDTTAAAADDDNDDDDVSQESRRCVSYRRMSTPYVQSEQQGLK